MGNPKKKNRKRDWSGNFTTPFTLCGYITSQRGEGYIIYYLFLHHLLLNVGQNIGHGLRRPICIVSSRFPFFSLLNGNLKWAEQLVIQALFLFFCEQETKMRLLFPGVVFGQHAPSRRHERPHTCVGLCITFRWFVSSSIYSCFFFFWGHRRKRF